MNNNSNIFQNHSKPASQAIIAIHGAGLQGKVWACMLPHLLPYPVEALNLPGHLDKKALLPTVEDMAQWLKQQLSQYAPGSIVLLGHSMGAAVALAAADHPAVSGLVLLGAAPAMAVHPDLLKAAMETPAEAAKLILKWGIYSDHPQKEAVNQVLSSLMRETEPDALGSDLSACNNFKGMEAAARQCRKPVLVISGAEDKMTRTEEGRKLAGYFHQGAFVELQDCGHMLMTEKPIESSREILRFMKDLPC